MASMHAARASNPIDYHVGQRIKARRKLIKMTQQDLGEMLGITFQQIQKYERGSNRVSAGRLWNLSEILNVPIQYFYDGLPISRAREVAEPGQAKFDRDSAVTSDRDKFLQAYDKIKSAKVRKRVLQLITTMAEEDE